MLIRDMCGGCEELKEALKEPIEKGEIGLVDVKSEEGQKAAATLGVEYVPAIYFDDGGRLHRCAVKPREGAIDIECDDAPADAQASAPQPPE